MAKDSAAKQDKAPKTRMAAMLKESMGVAKARNRSSDLVKLQENFNALIKKLKSLTIVLKNQHAAMTALAKSRFEVAAEVARLSERSPIFECVGELASQERPASEVCSYFSIHKQMAEKAKSYTAKYGQFVVEYVMEWEKVLTNRISVGLKKAEALRIDLDHYQQKVEALRQSANQTMVKGKSVDSRTADKLSRNEEKFIKSKQEYDVFATDLCILIEEVTERGWRDLHPLMVKLAQFDATMSDDEAKLMATLNQVVHQLKDIATRNGVSPQARLKDIESLQPELLNTRVGGSDSLRIEGGDNGSVFGTASTTSSLPPGSVGPQGLGGFPVAIAKSEEDRARTSSFGSYESGLLGQNSGERKSPGRSNTFNVTASSQRTMRPAPGAPSTYDILQMSSAAAPPPTLDQLNDAYPMGRSASGTLGLPPLGALSLYGGDASSVYSGASAPAPAPMAPPPPPPSAPPPPPPQAMGMMYPIPGHGGQPLLSNSYGAPPLGSYGQAPAGGSFGQPGWNTGYPQQLPQQQQQQQQPQYGVPPQLNYGQPQPPPQQQGYNNPYNNAQNHQLRSSLNSTNPFDG